MELGQSVLRRSGVNVLYNAVHPDRGLVWTDGRNIFLSPLKVNGSALDYEQAQRLGGLEDIQGLTWSCDFPGGWCYLCVVQQQKISIWRVEGMLPSNLKMKLVRKISKSALPQGCLWNPSRELLCLVTKEQSIVYYKHTDDKMKLVLPNLEEGKVLTCATWSADGEKLIVATQGLICSLWVYVWDKIDAKLKQFHSWSWTCPLLTGGIIRSAAAASDDLIFLSTELQMNQLVRTGGGDQDAFDHSVSPTERLLNVTGAKEGAGDAAQLLLLSVLSQAALLQFCVALKGMLVPDLLCYMAELHQVVVGSNSQSTLQIYTIESTLAEGTSSSRPRLVWDTDIVLASSERPKGVCVAPGTPRTNVLLLLGTICDTAADVTFPPSGMECKYNLHLSLMSLAPGLYVQPLVGGDKAVAGTLVDASIRTQNGVSPTPSEPLVVELPPPGQELPPTSVQLSESLSLSSSSSSTLFSASKLQASAGEATCESGSSGSVHALSSAKSALDADFAAVRLLEVNASMHDAARTSPSSSPDSTHHSAAQNSGGQTVFSKASEYVVTSVPHPGPPLANPTKIDTSSEITELQLMLSSQAQQIAALRKRLDELAAQVEETSCVGLNVYQEAESPDVVQLVYHDKQGPTAKRTFLLDKGRLKLDTLKSVFGVSHLELLLDGLAIVLTGNIDGYVPLRFESGRTYHVGCDGLENAVPGSGHQAPAINLPLPPRAHNSSADSLLALDRDVATSRPAAGGYDDAGMAATTQSGLGDTSQCTDASPAAIDAGPGLAPSIISVTTDDSQAVRGVERLPRRRPSAKAPAPPLPVQPPPPRVVSPGDVSAQACSPAAGGAYIDITAAL